MSIIEAIILGLVQGLAEFLPISSSGHLVILQKIMGVDVNAHFLFNILVHFGTLLAVFVVFRKTIWNLIKAFFKMLKPIFTFKFKFKSADPYEKMVLMVLLSLVPLFFILPLQDYIETYINNSMIIVGLILIFTALILKFSSSKYCKRNNKDIGDASPLDAVLVGIAQAVATLPGLSRSGSTITMGLFRGFTREHAAEFSFIMSIPAILGATFLEVKDVIEVGFDMANLPAYIIGTLVATVSGYFAIRMLSKIMKNDKFAMFAPYCVVVGITVILLGIIK